jgi:hypothetical protein
MDNVQNCDSYVNIPLRTQTMVFLCLLFYMKRVEEHWQISFRDEALSLAQHDRKAKLQRVDEAVCYCLSDVRNTRLLP